MRITQFCIAAFLAVTVTGCGSGLYPPAPALPTATLPPVPPVSPPNTPPATPGNVALADTMFFFDHFAAFCNPSKYLLGVGTIADAQGLVFLWQQYGLKRIVIVLGDSDIINGVADPSIAAQYATLVKTAHATGLSVVIAKMPPVYAGNTPADYQPHVDALNAAINAQIDEASDIYGWPLGAVVSAQSLYDPTTNYDQLTPAGCSAMLTSYATINQ